MLDLLRGDEIPTAVHLDVMLITKSQRYKTVGYHELQAILLWIDRSHG